MKRYLLPLYWKYIFFPEISRDKWGINDRAFDDSSTSLFVPSHEILFSRVCGPLLRERETGFTAKSAPGTGCWLCNMNVEDCRGARKAVQQGEKRTETSAVSGQVSGGGCRPCTILRFRMFLLAFAKLFFFSFSSFIISEYTCTARCKSNNLSISEYRALHDPTYFRVNNKYCRTNIVGYELLQISPRERRDN